MVSKFQSSFLLVLVILSMAFLIRLYNPSFPFFTSDEARIAYRGYTLATVGRDELGRSFPILFNSLTDYQLPTVSYITGLGALLFGKTDFAVRMPFILISILIVIIIYKTSEIFNLGKEFRIFCGLIAVFSPVLIFLSKIPNDMIVLSFSLILLFYLLTKREVNFFYSGLVMIFAFATSKIAWWILVPFTGFTLIFFQKHLLTKTKIMILMIPVLLTLFSVGLFLQVPQATRSLLENDLSILQDPSIKITVDRLRGQGIEAGWPNFLERILFNKLQIVTVGFINWLSAANPAILFGQFDETGINGFVGMGAFPKIAIFPFLAGLVFIIKKGYFKLQALIFYYLLLTFPLAFVYPPNYQSMIVVTLPFLIFIIALGLTTLNRFLKYAVLALIILEVSINIFYFSPQIKHTSGSRPIWIKKIVEDSYNFSASSRVAISDDFTSDIASFLQWYAPLSTGDYFSKIHFPYKFRQSQVGNIKIIGSDDTFYFCGLDKPTYVFASKRDLEEIQKWLNIDTPKTIVKAYKDDLDKEVIYFLKPTICVH